MSLKEPNDILKDFQAEHTKLLNAKKPLSADEQNAMALCLADVLNYLSGSVRKPSLQNAIYSTSAHDARVKEQLDKERKQLELHRSFVESSFEKCDQYLRTIQLGGYAAFFGLWGLTREYIAEKHSLYILLLMLTSAAIFMAWEIFKSSILAISMHRHSSIGLSSVEKFLVSRSGITSRQSAVIWLTKYRLWPWFLTVLPAISSLIYLFIVIFKKAV